MKTGWILISEGQSDLERCFHPVGNALRGVPAAIVEIRG